MQTSTTTAKLDAALAAAQGELTDPAKTKWNPHLKSHYADVQAGLEVIRPVLSKHGIAVVQATSITDGFVIVTTRLAHKGEWIESVYPVGPASTAHQTLMANLTYARRAGLFGLVGVAPDDADGEGTTQAGPKPGAQSQQQRAAARSLEKAANAPIPQPAGDFPGDTPAHNPETGEVVEDLLPHSESEAAAAGMIDKLESMSRKGQANRANLGVWARSNAPLKKRLQPQHAKDVTLVFDALVVAVRQAEKLAKEAAE